MDNLSIFVSVTFSKKKPPLYIFFLLGVSLGFLKILHINWSRKPLSRFFFHFLSILLISEYVK